MPYGELGDHSNATVNMKFTQRLKELFGALGDKHVNNDVVDEKRGMGSVQFHKHNLDMPVNSKIDSSSEKKAPDQKQDNDFIETGVCLVNNPLSNVFKEEVMREMNLLTFLGSSQEVGASSKKKSRYYRVSTKSPTGGLFQLSSDASLIECSQMQDIEEKLVDLVSSLMEEQDKIIAEANPGKNMCKWVHDKTMCQLTAGTMKDSAYGIHTNCGFHHNHTMESANEATTEIE